MTSTFAPRRALEPRAESVDLDDFVSAPIVLPEPWTAPARAPLPLVASAVPIVGAVVLWLVTSSPVALVLAALGPLIAVASVLDGSRGARRDRRRAHAAQAEALARAERSIQRRKDADRARRRARHPDVGEFLQRDDEIWRDVPDRVGSIVIGRGDDASGIRVDGAHGDAASDALRSSAARLEESPIVIDLSGGIAVVGPPVLASAVHRALILQLCLAIAPGDLRIVGPGDAGSDADWSAILPHRHGTRGVRVSVSSDPDVEADIVIALVAPGESMPAGCRTILSVESPRRAVLDRDGRTRPLAIEAVGIAQAGMIASELVDRAKRTLGLVAVDESPVAFADVIADAPPAHGEMLAAVIGRSGAGAATVDLVSDGPHAVVAGVTGTGKSELLITWVLALAAAHSTSEVSFLLADFKGGTAFDALRLLPHVTGVITDLDGSGARRALESLRAEVRWREGELARHGARDILDPRVTMPRLVVVVDEFAAVLADHPELHVVFTDVAARGRALGIHLVLGTQRVAGVVRDGLLANCPLRISLRVTDAADSRCVLGVDDAALLPGGVAGRGLALVRRASDVFPTRIRVALSGEADIRAVATSTVGPAPRRPWLPALPSEVALHELRDESDAAGLILGLTDEPEHQRQDVAVVSLHDRGLLVVGGPGSGRSSALEVLARQADAVVRVPPNGEGAWDALATLAEKPPAPGTVVVIDDLDALASRVTPEHASVMLERLEHVVRMAGDAGILVLASAQRLAGQTARIAEMLPRRLILGTSSRADHIAVGGEPGLYAPEVPPGRGRMGRIAVQVAWAGHARERAPSVESPRAWFPDGPLAGVATRRRSLLDDAIAQWAASGIRCVGIEAYTADPTLSADGPLVVVGDPDQWQREWRLLASVRSDHEFVIDTSCAAEYRVLTASRELPPFAEARSGRAWRLRADGDAERIVLPGGDVRSLRLHAES